MRQSFPRSAVYWKRRSVVKKTMCVSEQRFSSNSAAGTSVREKFAPFRNVSQMTEQTDWYLLFPPMTGSLATLLHDCLLLLLLGYKSNRDQKLNLKVSQM